MLRVALLSLLAAATAAYSQTPSGGRGGEELAANNDAWIAGAIVTLTGRADQDLWVAGANLDIAVDVGGNLNAAGANVLIHGDVAGNIRAAGANLRLTADMNQARLAAASVDFDGVARGDLYAVGARVTIGENAVIMQKAELAAAYVDMRGDIEGGLSGAAGEFNLSGRVGGDLQITAESVHFSDGALIEGDFNYTGPNPPDIPEGMVTGSVTTTVQDYEFEDEMGADGADLVGRFAMSLCALLVGLGFAAFFPGVVENVSARARQRPVASVFVGLATLVLIPIVAILLMFTVIGTPLGVLSGLAYPFALFIGFVFGALAIGSMFSFIKNRNDFRRRALGLALALAASFILGLIPIVGGLVGFSLLALGLGAIALSLLRAPQDAVTA